VGTITPCSCSSAGTGAMPSLAPNGNEYGFTSVNLEEGLGLEAADLTYLLQMSK